MSDLLEFDSDLHKDLFCLLILESSSATYRELRYYPVNDSDYIESVVINEYELFYEDRSIAPIEHEGWVSENSKEMMSDERFFRFHCWKLHRLPIPMDDNCKKLIFRFEEE